MYWEKEQADPNELPTALKEAFEEIKLAEQVCPGVYYVSARRGEEDPAAREYYVVFEDAPAISSQARAYGEQLPDWPDMRLYSFDQENSGYGIIEYEICRYQLKNSLPTQGDASLHSIAIYHMEQYPGYFGAYPVPLVTPRGYTVRHKALMNGIYWLETDRGEEVLAVCYPIWECDVTEETQRRGEQTDFDREHGIDTTLGYLFFPEEAACLVLFELWPCYEGLRTSGLIHYKALMNAIWSRFPEYAAAYNAQEQLSLHDSFGLLLHAVGCETELKASPDRMIALSPEEQVPYLNI